MLARANSEYFKNAREERYEMKKKSVHIWRRLYHKILF
jgi:hypothetical protein